jgi:hypothetical protein
VNYGGSDGTTWVFGGSVLVIDVADSDTSNSSLTIEHASDNWRIVEHDATASALPTPSAGCSYGSGGTNTHEINCPSAFLISHVVVFAGAGDDSVEFSVDNPLLQLSAYGELGDDVLAGGSGADFLAGDVGATDSQNDYRASDSVADGADLLIGGCGQDFYAGGGGSDTVSFTNDGCVAHDAGVTVTLSDTASAMNDATEGEDVGGAQNSIENVTGTPGSDTITGDSGPNIIEGGAGADAVSGGAGNDSLLPQGGVDEVFGGAGDDDSNTRDSGADTVHCDDGADDEVIADAIGIDVVDGDCEFVDRGTPTPPVDPSPPTNPTPPTNPAPPANPAGSVEVGGVLFKRVSDTTRRKAFPEIRGMQYSAAETKLNKLALAGTGPYVEWKPAGFRYGSARSGGPLGTNPTGGAWQEGDVLAVRYVDGGKTFTSPGALVSTGAATPVVVTLTLYGGVTHDSCLQDARDLAGVPFSEREAMLKALHCKVDDTMVELVKSTTSRGEVDLDSGYRCEAGKKVALAGNGRIDETITVPEGPRETDLRIYTMESTERASLVAGKGTLIASGGTEAFLIYVGSRTAQYQLPDGRWVSQKLNGGTVYVDATSVGAGTFRKVTGTGNQEVGTTKITLTPHKPGRIRIAATWTDSRGKVICGATHLDVVGTAVAPDAKRKTPGTTIRTEMGRTWRYTGAGWVDADRNTHVSSSMRRGRAAGDPWYKQFGDAIVAFFTGSQPEVVAAAGSTPTAAAAVDKLDARIAHLNLGASTALGTPASFRLIGNDGAGIVAAGAGNIVAQGAGNLISSDGASVVPSTGTNMLLGYSTKVGVIAKGGGTLITNDGAGVVANAGDNVVAQGAGNIISTNGGGIVAQGGGNIIAATGSNIVAQGGGN